LLPFGGIAATGTNYSQIGTKAAKLVYLLYQKRKLSTEIGITQFEDKTLYINKKKFETYLPVASLAEINHKYLSL
jgi:ABC-type uncharacterized transport system substrate-binding protein